LDIDNMTTHITAMTYAPKVEAIKNGDCRQTTRIYNEKNPFRPNDMILNHGWEGRPYWSKWSWRRPKERVAQVIDMLAFDNIATFYQNPITGMNVGTESLKLVSLPWHDEVMDELARLDGIAPATGPEYKSVLEGFHGRFAQFDPARFQIIRW